ncbi:AMP-binding protein, partial [bacterium]|nr:AMP-binding protein [bacterium]
MPLTEAKILSENEQEKILIDWNKTELTFPDKKTVPELFEENVRKNPDNIALIFNEEKLTYKELNNRANKLAQHLRNHISEKGKTGGDVLIGLCSERSTDSIVAMLAILKAGGAYVPMDVEYPEERIRFMLSDTGMQTVVAQKKILKALPFLAEDG